MKTITKYGEQSLKTKETSFSFQNVFYESEQQSLRFNIDLRWFNNKLCLLRLQPSKLSNIVLGISSAA
jgi:hypothetical protein